MKKGWLMAVAVTVMAGCSMNPDTTAFNAADWQSYGYDQGNHGRVAMNFDQQKATSEMIASYQQGYAQGLQQYCAQDPVALGKAQRAYLGVCDAQNPNFRAQFSEGLWWDDGASLD